MSLFNLPVTHKKKPEDVHPWARHIKEYYAARVKYAHNSIRNPAYPKPKTRPRKRYGDPITFTIIGNRVTKEFIYCVRLVEGMHKYKTNIFSAPIIRGVTGVEWPRLLRELGVKYGPLTLCTGTNVIVLCNNQLLGGLKELKDLIETKHLLHLAIDYQKEAVTRFSNFIKASGRVCAYMHVSINDKPIGSLIFMLYSDICPMTCNNFLRLCHTRRGGYSGTPIHRIVKDGWIQCGGFSLKDVPMMCENFIVMHDKRGVLAMANDGWHNDCSTQFFVLLQPQPWMKSKYVAFGQLIDGEETLLKIEKVETFYESPKSNIIIYRAGVLNLDCDGIIVSQSTNEYINGHIDDLITIGEIFIQMLMEYVYLEIEFRHLAALEPPQGEFPTAEEMQRKHDIENRFNDKKEKINELGINQPVIRLSNVNQNKKEEVNTDFDVDTYDYEPEEYAYSRVTPVPDKSVEPKAPFYIPLTDVPYSGDKDSQFDLKRFLQGDYCLEADLDRNLTKKQVKVDEAQIMIRNEIIKTMRHYQHLESDVTLPEEEQKKFEEYMRQYAEIASFGGPIIQKIADQFISSQPLEAKPRSRPLTDEETRRVRLAHKDIIGRTAEKPAVHISESPWATHSKVKRRQTGFISPADLLKMQIFADDEEEEEIEEEEKKPKVKKGISIQDDENEKNENDDVNWDLKACKESSIKFKVLQDETEDKTSKIKRRQTGFVYPDMIARLKKYKKDLDDNDDEDDDDEDDDDEDDDDEDDDDDDDDDDDEDDDDDDDEDDDDGKDKTNDNDIKKNDDEENKSDSSDIKQTASKEPAIFNSEYEKESKLKQPVINSYISGPNENPVMTRLLNNAGVSAMANDPTLKDYKPVTEIERKNILLTASKNMELNVDPDHISEHRKSSTVKDRTSVDQVLSIQYGKAGYRKISADYIPIMDTAERSPERSIRAVEYAKRRPSLSIEEYQTKYNQQPGDTTQRDQKDQEPNGNPKQQEPPAFNKIPEQTEKKVKDG